MKGLSSSKLRRDVRRWLRGVVQSLPDRWRFALYRTMIECDTSPDSRLQLKIAETKEELEACFRLLHDAYVMSGFMKPDPSGMRITKYHALPTTTTLCATFDGRIVGTLSLIRDGVFGFPLQTAFDISGLRAKGGNIAEISALAIHPEFRNTGGWILFPLIKFMYEYCTRYFDTRHLVIAVNPNKIDLYEAVLFFRRLQAAVVEHYDFANGVPAVGATLDLHQAIDTFRHAYNRKADRRNLYKYFLGIDLPNIRMPLRPYHTTNDPVLTPPLLDHFFNRMSSVLDSLDQRQRLLLQSIYGDQAYESVLPAAMPAESSTLQRVHPRFSIRCPAVLEPFSTQSSTAIKLIVTELSRSGCRAESSDKLKIGLSGLLRVELGAHRHVLLHAEVIRTINGELPFRYGFLITRPDTGWLTCADALESGHTYSDLMDLVD